MWDMTPRKVLVGVETPDCRAALGVAAGEAARRGCGLHLVHVMRPVYASHPHLDELSLVAGELQHAGRAVVQAAAREARALLPEQLVVSTEICHGTVTGCLAEASHHASLLVLQHHPVGHGHGPMPTVQALAGRAGCPVLAVPDGWTDAVRRGVRPQVVVGYERTAASRSVVEAALAEAARRHAGVTVVHAVEGHEHDGLAPGVIDAWMRPQRTRVQTELADLVARHPDVPVDVDVRPGPASAVLMTAAADAVLVVVGRGHGRLPFPTRPGPVTADLLRHARVPVLVVGPPLGGGARHAPRLATVSLP